MKNEKSIPTVNLADYQHTFAQVMRGLLDRSGLSQARLCKLAKINKRMLTYYMSGERFPTPESTSKLAQAFGIPYAELKQQLVMSEARGILKRVWVLGVESQTMKKERLLDHQRKTAKERRDGDMAVESFNRYPGGIAGTTHSLYRSQDSRFTPTDQIDQSEWAPNGENGGFSIIEPATMIPACLIEAGLTEDDWKFFHQIAAREVWSSHMARRPKSYRSPSLAARYAKAIVDELVESMDDEQALEYAKAHLWAA